MEGPWKLPREGPLGEWPSPAGKMVAEKEAMTEAEIIKKSQELTAKFIMTEAYTKIWVMVKLYKIILKKLKI